MDLPHTVPLESVPPKAGQKEADKALARAAEIGSEYETVDVDTAVVRARTVGAGIVEEARRRGVELIVMGAEPPTQVRGGAVLGGVSGSRPPEIGSVTEYVLRKAPCRGLLTAPPEVASGRHVDLDRGSGTGRLVAGPGDAARGPRGLVPRRGLGGARPARGRDGR